MKSQREENGHDGDEHARVRADDDRWSALAFVGIQEGHEVRGPGDVIELRNCTCGSTLGRRTRRTP